MISNSSRGSATTLHTTCGRTPTRRSQTTPTLSHRLSNLHSERIPLLTSSHASATTTLGPSTSRTFQLLTQTGRLTISKGIGLVQTGSRRMRLKLLQNTDTILNHLHSILLARWSLSTRMHAITWTGGCSKTGKIRDSRSNGSKKSWTSSREKAALPSLSGTSR